MEEFDFKPTKRRRWFALGLVAVAVVNAYLDDALSVRLNMCATLLISWNLAFTPGPPIATPLREVYRMARQGWRTPWTSKLATALSIALLIAGTYFMFKGR
jgi:hypothetical protein